MKMVFRLGLASLLALFLRLDTGFASPGGMIPQAANGLQVTVTRSDNTGATLQVAASELMESSDGQALPAFSGGMVWAVPLDVSEILVSAVPITWREPFKGELPDSAIAQILAEPLPLTQTSPIMSLRGIPVASLGFNAAQPNESETGIRICEQFDIAVQYVHGGSPAGERVLSSSFYELARGVTANLDDVLPEPEITPEPYLIITRPAYVTALDELVRWRRARGHTVRIATTDETGTTAQQILSYLQNAYNNWEEPPVFVLLVGDVDGTNSLPTWEVPGFYTATIASDLPYTLLDGPDFLPDVFIGRISVDTEVELLSVVSKCVNYERQPFEPDGAWRSRMLIVGVRSSQYFYPTYNSSWPTLQWIGRQFFESGYAQVDSVPYPGGNASQINQYVNAGESFIGYRGFGSPGDWTFPEYNLNDMNGLANGARLTVVMSIVCGGGAFSYQTDPCFGEKWLRMGTPSTPKGAIGFIGPSELDTKTRFNNTNIAGIFDGILHEGVNTLSAAMLRGKMELVRQFPNNVNNHDPDSERSVSFYFKCYNLLGDPGQTFFVGPVRDLSAEVPPTLPRGTVSVAIVASEGGEPIDGAWATVQAGDTIYARAVSDGTGHLVLPLPQTGADSVIVTVAKPRHETQQSVIMLPTQTLVIGSSQTILLDDGSNGSSGNGDGLPNPGERLAVRMSVQNFGSGNYGGGSLHLSSQAGELQMVDSVTAVPALAPGAVSGLMTFRLDVAANAVDGLAGQLWASVDEGTDAWPVLVTVRAAMLMVDAIRTNGEDGNPPPNANSAIELRLSNSGAATAAAFSVVLRSLDSRVAVVDSVATYSALAPGQSAFPVDGGFQIAMGGLYPGDYIPVELHAENDDWMSTVLYSVPVGNLADSDPTHPDSYGYRMFQDSDTGYAEAPTYSWVEIDPAHGGMGTVIALNDTAFGRDTTTTISLPFSFSFYGMTYTQVSVCSNGFVSFGETDENYFRNYALPAIASPDNMVCVFWDDLAIRSGGRLCQYYDVTGGRFIIEWSRLRNLYGLGTSEETFELILTDTECWPTRTGDGDLVMQHLAWANVDSWDNYSTVGLQDRDQGYALPVAYAGDTAPGVSTLGSGQALLFTTGRPTDGSYVAYAGSTVDDDSSGGSFGNGDGIPQNAETVQLEVRLQNTGTLPAPAAVGNLRSLDPLAVLLDSVITFPEIGAGQIQAGGSVRLIISALAPHRHSSNFVLSLAGNAVPCVVLPSIMVSAPLLGLTATQVNDDSIPPSIGNSNGELNAGETIELLPIAGNTGGNAAHGTYITMRRLSGPVTLEDTAAFVGEIAAGAEQSATDPLLLQVNGTVPDGTPIHLMLTIHDEYQNTTTVPVNFMVTAPDLSSMPPRVADPAPGGNGDNRLTNGESGELYPRVTNSGLGAASNVVLTLSTQDTTVVLQNSTVVVGTISPQSTRESNIPVTVIVASGTEPRNVPLLVHISADDGIQLDHVEILTIGNVQLYDDLEHGASGWSVYGTPGLWHLQSREANTPTHAFYCGTEGSLQYPPNADAYLRTLPFQFEGTGRLIFTTKYATQPDADYGRVDLQVGPSTYYLLDQISGDHEEWQQRQYDLTGYPASETAYIRFWFESDASGSAEGWYLDDVILMDESTPATEAHDVGIPDRVSLDQNYPNPFNNRTEFSFALPHRQKVTIRLYDITGRLVATLLDDTREAGIHRIAWTPLQAASGIYFLRLESGDATLTRKVMLLK